MKVYFLPIEETKKIDKEIFKAAFPDRFLRSEKCLKEEDRLRILGAGALLYGILGVSENDIIYGPNGKLFISKSDVHFNLSHSGNYSVLAVSDKDVGIDIEKVDAKHLKVAAKIYLEEEISWMKDDSLYRFHHLWTLKESYLKLIGKGLSVSPSSFSVLPIIKSGHGLIHNEICYGKTEYIYDHIVSVCSKEEISSFEMVFCESDIIRI